jgi:hypothetical protein
MNHESHKDPEGHEGFKNAMPFGPPAADIERLPSSL